MSSRINMSRTKRFSTNEQKNFRRSRVDEYSLKSIPIPEQSRVLSISLSIRVEEPVPPFLKAILSHF
jgi:hypothetical protein